MQGDEDEGSPTQGGVNGNKDLSGFREANLTGLGPENRKFSGSPPGQPAPTLFPLPKEKPFATPAGNCPANASERGQEKTAKTRRTQSLI